ncbi:hypothetical protein DH96_01435 [Candidatus Phytoplasma oryzae]|uniref:Cold-shock protein n=1 Tax=Candidatus Phytoplasma oryzae TaxID=203274 RepID=A0A328ILP9_9MOLU|nr:cold-shock protein [Candidatus Phytoplasma oryzae]RAM57748.1 hypothetical protein DH96_01435 [Candidatus Phytoplasma oryzae]
MTKFRGIVKWFAPEKGFGFISNVVKLTEEKKYVKLPNDIIANKDSEPEAIEQWKRTEQETGSNDIFCHFSSILKESKKDQKQEEHNMSDRNNSFFNNEDKSRIYANSNIKKLVNDEEVEFVIRFSEQNGVKKVQAMDIIVIDDEKDQIIDKNTKKLK